MTCRYCPNPTNGSNLCTHHRRIDTEQTRARRHAKSEPKRQCPLCLEYGHYYKTCKLNN